MKKLYNGFRLAIILTMLILPQNTYADDCYPGKAGCSGKQIVDSITTYNSTNCTVTVTTTYSDGSYTTETYGGPCPEQRDQ